MASIREVIVRMGEILKAEFESLPDEFEVFVYDDVPEVNETPAVVISPAPRDTADFNGSFGKGMDTWNIDVIVMVAKTEWSVAQEKLAEFIDGNGTSSIRRILHNDDLDLANTSCHVEGVRLYGGQFENAKIPHVGAVIKVTVRTSGT